MTKPTREQTKNGILDISLNDTEVGTITLLPDDRTLFVFDEAYIENKQRPTLSLSFKTPLGDLRTEEKIRSQAKLPPFFSNLLPEGYLRAYFARKLKISTTRDFPFLAALGADLPGAVRVRSFRPLKDDLSTEETTASDSANLRFSLAGVQPKFSVIVGPSGDLETPSQGTGGNWIAKLPTHMVEQLPEAEYSMLSLAKHIGLDVPEFKLVPTRKLQGLPDEIERSNEYSLLVKRFDRRENDSRIHMEDFAQVFGIFPDNKYEQASFDRIGYVILTESGEKDFLEYIKRLVLTVLTGNGDMHLKNWSLLYKDGYKPSLSPAYDLVPTILFLPKDSLALKLGGTKSFLDVTERNFANLANKARAPESLVINVVRETIEQVIDAWKAIRSDLPLSEEAKNTIELHMRSAHLIKLRKHISLPTINLKTCEVMRLEEPLPESGSDKRQEILGTSYVFNSQRVLEEATKSNATLDQYLTRRIAAELYKRRLKGKLLFLYSVLANGQFALTITSRTTAECRWIAGLPGCSEAGRDWAPDNASLFMYWDGKRAHRIYDSRIRLGIEERDEQAEYYTTDLGGFNPPHVYPSNRDDYRHVRKYADAEYSAVPTRSPEKVKLDGNDAVIYHSFVRLIK